MVMAALQQDLLYYRSFIHARSWYSISRQHRGSRRLPRVQDIMGSNPGSGKLFTSFLIDQLTDCSSKVLFKWSLAPSLYWPDRPFHSFRASKSGDLRILCRSKTRYNEFLKLQSCERSGRGIKFVRAWRSSLFLSVVSCSPQINKTYLFFHFLILIDWKTFSAENPTGPFTTYEPQD